MLVFLEYIFQFFINIALPPSNSVDWQIFMSKELRINLTGAFTIRSRGATDNTLNVHVGLSSFFLVLLFFCFFRKTYFHFLTDLNNTGRLIAGSLSAFIAKIQ